MSPLARDITIMLLPFLLLILTAVALSVTRYLCPAVAEKNATAAEEELRRSLVRATGIPIGELRLSKGQWLAHTAGGWISTSDLLKGGYVDVRACI